MEEHQYPCENCKENSADFGYDYCTECQEKLFKEWEEEHQYLIWEHRKNTLP